MEIGIFSFGDILAHPVTGVAPTTKQKLREIVKLATLADEVGLDVFAVGEHHRLDMVVSSPAVVLAAIAERTKRIRLSSSTTLLNTLDPVRVYEDFATLDLLSDGRAEILAGRGSFTESFELFGYDMKDYDSLFAEKLDLLLQINKVPRVTWSGRHRAPLEDAQVAPRAEAPIPVWVGVGGTPQSAVRAGSLGLPMNIAILGGPERFVDFVEIYRRAGAQAGHAGKLKLAISSHGHIGDDSKTAKDEFIESWGGIMRKGLENRFPPRNVPREYLEMEAGPKGAFFAGDAKEITQKILWQHDLFHHDRLLLQVDWATPYAHAARSIEILGQEIAPAVREAIGT